MFNFGVAVSLLRSWFRRFWRTLLPIAVLLLVTGIYVSRHTCLAIAPEKLQPQRQSAGKCVAGDLSQPNQRACWDLDARPMVKVPEPATLVLFSAGVLSIAAVIRKRKAR